MDIRRRSFGEGIASYVADRGEEYQGTIWQVIQKRVLLKS